MADTVGGINSQNSSSGLRSNEVQQRARPRATQQEDAAQPTEEVVERVTEDITNQIVKNSTDRVAENITKNIANRVI